MSKSAFEVLEDIVVMNGMFGVIGGSVEIGGEGFTLYFSSSSLSVVLSLCFPMHTHTQSTRYILTASSSYPHPSTHLTTQDDSEDSDKYTALIFAAMRGYVEAVKALVAADPDLAHLNMKVSVP